MNILRYKLLGRPYRDDDGGSDNGSDGSDSHFSNQGNLNTYNGATQSSGGGWYSPGYSGGNNNQSPVSTGTPTATVKDQDAAPDAAASSGVFGSGGNGGFSLPNIFSPEFAKNAISTFTLPSQQPTTQQPTWFKPGSMAYRLGLRDPGTTKDQFFNSETEAEKNDRMGLIGNGIGAIGNGITGVATAMSPIGPLMGLANGIKSYTNDGNIGNAVAKGISGIPGWGGVLGNTFQGNYGSAVAGGLGLNGVNRNLANIAGLGTDFGTGKNVSPTLGGMLGRVAGGSIGGTGGAMFGSSLGQQFGRKFSLRK
jgi:hypothetical protein